MIEWSENFFRGTLVMDHGSRNVSRDLRFCRSGFVLSMLTMIVDRVDVRLILIINASDDTEITTYGVVSVSTCIVSLSSSTLEVQHIAVIYTI